MIDKERIENRIGIIAGNIAILSKKNLSTYKKMIKFRNTIVHLYHIVDDRIVYKITKGNPGDFDKFIKEIKKLIK